MINYRVDLSTRMNTDGANKDYQAFKVKVEKHPLNINFKVDSSGLENISKAIDRISTKQQQLSANEKTFNDWSRSLSVVKTETNKYIDSQKALNTVITKTTSNGQVYQTRIKETKDELGRVITETQNYVRIQGRLAQAGSKVTNVIGDEVRSNNELVASQEKVNKLLLDAKAKSQLASTSFSQLAKSIVSATGKVMLFHTATLAIGLFTDAVRESINVVANFDKELTEFKKVSDLDGQALDDYTKKLGELGEAVARTRTEMLSASQEFVKSGFGEEQAAQLAQISELFRNVMDEEVSSAESAGFIVSQMKAYGDESTQFAEHTVNAINKISNNMAVSSSDIESGLSKTASAMATAGNTFDESAALVTAATEVMHGQANKASRGLRTISANISKLAATTGELTYTVNGMEKSISLIDETTGDMKNTFEVFRDIYTNGWNEMSHAEQESLALQIANKTQLEVATSVLSNFEGAEKALSLALNSQNSAWDENSKYMESIEAKLARIRTAYENLVLGEGGLSKVVKFVLDLTAGFLEFINKNTTLVVALTATTIALVALNKQLQVTKSFTIMNLFGGLIESIGFFITTVMSATTATEGLNLALQMLNINPIVAALTAITALGVGLYALFDKLITTQEEYQEQIDELTNSVNDLVASNKQLNDEYNTLSKKTDLTDQEKTRLELLKAQIEANKQLIQQEYEKRAQTQIEKDKASIGDFTLQTGGAKSVSGLLNYDMENASVLELSIAYQKLNETKAESLEQDNEIQSKKTEIISKLSEEGLALLDLRDKGVELTAYDEERLRLIEQTIGSLQEQTDAEVQSSATIEEVADEYGYTTDQMEEFLEAHEDLRSSLENGESDWYDIADAMSEAGVQAEDTNDSLQNLSSDIKTLAEDYESLQSAVDDYNNGNGVSLESFDALIKAATEYSGCLDFQNGKLVLSEQYFEQLAEQKIANAKADLVMETQARLAALATQEEGEAAQVTSGIINSATASVDDICVSLQNMANDSITAAQAWSVLANTMNGSDLYSNHKEGYNQIYKDFKAQWNALDELGKGITKNLARYSKASGGASKSAAGSSKDAWIEAYKAEKETIDAMYENGTYSAEQYQEKLLELQAKYLTDTVEHQQKYASEIKKLYEDIYKALKKAAKEALDDEVDRRKKQLDNLKDEAKKAKELQKRQHEEEEKGIKKRIDLLKREKDSVKESYNEKIDALKREREEYENQVKLMQLKEKLAKAKVTYQYIMDEKGRFNWLADQQAVDAAQEDLYEEELKQAYERQLKDLEDARDAAEKLYDQQIQDLEDYYDEVKERNEKAEQDLEDHYNELEAQYERSYNDFKDYASKVLERQIQATNDENTEWGRRLNNLAEFVNNYNAMLAQLGNAGASVSNNYKGSSSSSVGGGGGGSSASNGRGGNSAVNAANASLAVSAAKRNAVSAVKSVTNKVASVVKSVFGKHAKGVAKIDTDEMALVGDSPNQEIAIGSKLNGVPLNLSAGSGVVNAKSTKTLAGLLNSLPNLSPNYSTTNNSNSQSIHIDNINLPRVTNGEEFINYLENFDINMIQNSYSSI